MTDQQGLVPFDPGAVLRQAMGMLTDEDSRRLRRKLVTVTPEEEMAADLIWQHPNTEYKSFTDFARHAIYELIMSHVNAGFAEGKATGETMGVMAMARDNYHRLKTRGEFAETFEQTEEALNDWTALADWKAIDRQLGTLDAFLRDTRPLSEKWAWRFEELVAKSTAVKRAIDGLHDAWRLSKDDELREKASHWTTWLEELSQS